MSTPNGNIHDSNLAIDVYNLAKNFKGKPAVVDISLHVRTGEIFGFMGPNGGGKTTTMRMLCGLLTPDGGHGTCLGFDILTQSIELKHHIGYMTQQFSLYDELTIRENLEFAANLYDVKDSKKLIDEQIADLNLEQRADQLVGTLSGGWKQRLALSAAVLHRPKLLFLDEPTAGVDPKSRREFWEHIHLLSSRGVTTLVSTHYMDEAGSCNRLAYVFQGRILSQGSKAEIIANSGLKAWEMRGENLSDLSVQMKKLPGVEIVVTLEDAVHVCGKDAELLKQSVLPYQERGYKLQQINPTLEDVFVSLG